MRCVNLQGTAMIVKYFIIIKLFNVPSIIF